MKQRPTPRPPPSLAERYKVDGARASLTPSLLVTILPAPSADRAFLTRYHWQRLCRVRHKLPLDMPKYIAEGTLPHRVSKFPKRAIDLKRPLSAHLRSTNHHFCVISSRHLKNALRPAPTPNSQPKPPRAPWSPSFAHPPPISSKTRYPHPAFEANQFALCYLRSITHPPHQPRAYSSFPAQQLQKTRQSSCPQRSEPLPTLRRQYRQNPAPFCGTSPWNFRPNITSRNTRKVCIIQKSPTTPLTSDL